MNIPDPAPRPEVPDFSPVIALLTVARRWDAELSDALRDLRLTTRKYALLGHIKSSPGISFSELARRSRITVQSAHVAVAAFITDDWVRDTTSHAGSKSVLELTVEGEKLLAAAAARLRNLDAQLGQAHGPLADALLVMMREQFAPGTQAAGGSGNASA